MESKEIMMVGDLYPVPISAQESELRNVDGEVVAKLNDFEHAALIAQSHNHVVNCIRRLSCDQTDKLIGRVATGQTTFEDGQLIADLLRPMTREF